MTGRKIFVGACWGVIAVLLAAAFASAQCSNGSCATPTIPQLQAQGYVRVQTAPGRFTWMDRETAQLYQPKAGIAVDRRGRTYAVPVRAAAKGFGDWIAAPRLQPVGSPIQKAGCQCRTSECNGQCGMQACTDGSCSTQQDLPSELPEEPSGAGSVAERGPEGPPGPQGPAGPKGDPGEVDYGKVADLVASAVNTSVETSINRVLPQLEEAIVERMAADPRFRGADGRDGQDGRDATQLSDAELDALAAKLATRLPGITFHKRDADGQVTDSETVPLGGQLYITGKLLNASE